MSKKKPRTRPIDLVAVANLRDELAAFANDFDISDPVQMEVELDTHISNVLAATQMKLKKNQNDLHLDDLVAYLLKIPEDNELVVYARSFRTLISSYGGDPTDEDMEEAYEILTNIIETLNGTEGIREAYGQARIDFE